MQGRSPAIGATAGLDEAYRLCRQQGLRLSRQRRLVLEILWRSGEHLSARDIFDRLNADGRRIGHTSVYQNLESLHSNGVIECLEKAQGRLSTATALIPTATSPAWRAAASATLTLNFQLIWLRRLNNAPATASRATASTSKDDHTHDGPARTPLTADRIGLGR